jgi:hypothetical protein
MHESGERHERGDEERARSDAADSHGRPADDRERSQKQSNLAS